MVEQAVILASGAQGPEHTHKAGVSTLLCKIAGLSLLKRNLLVAQDSGIQQFFILFGDHEQALRQSIGEDPRLKDKITWVKIEKASDGLRQALLKLQAPFLFLPSDRIFDSQFLKALLRHVPPKGQSLFFQDARETQQETGFAIHSDEFFTQLREGGFQGEAYLKEVFNKLKANDRIEFREISEGYWQPVDAEKSIKPIEKKLCRDLVTPNYGPVARYLNKAISLPISRVLVRTNITPNQISYFNLLIGILAAFLISFGDYHSLIWGGLLFQLASIMDGCDGEVAKLKWQSTAKGAWVDTIADNVSYVIFFVGVTIGMFNRTGSSLVLGVGAVAFLCQLSAFLMMYLFLKRKRKSGSLLGFRHAFVSEAKQESLWSPQRLFSKIRYAVERDFFSFLFFILALLNQLALIFWLLVTGSVILFLAVLRTFRKVPKPLTKAFSK